MGRSAAARATGAGQPSPTPTVAIREDEDAQGDPRRSRERRDERRGAAARARRRRRRDRPSDQYDGRGGDAGVFGGAHASKPDDAKDRYQRELDAQVHANKRARTSRQLSREEASQAMGIAGRIERSHYPDSSAAGPNAGAPDNFMGGAGAHPSALGAQFRPGMAPNAPVDGTAEYASQLEQQIAARAERDRLDREARFGKPAIAPDHVMSRIGESERSDRINPSPPRRHALADMFNGPNEARAQAERSRAQRTRGARGTDRREAARRRQRRGRAPPAAPVDRQSAASLAAGTRRGAGPPGRGAGSHRAAAPADGAPGRCARGPARQAVRRATSQRKFGLAELRGADPEEARQLAAKEDAYKRQLSHDLAQREALKKRNAEEEASRERAEDARLARERAEIEASFEREKKDRQKASEDERKASIEKQLEEKRRQKAQQEAEDAAREAADEERLKRERRELEERYERETRSELSTRQSRQGQAHGHAASPAMQ